MAYRIFEGVAHAESYFKFRPSYPADLFQKILSFLREKRPPPNQLLVDVGCGSGQGTYGLSSQFERVIGFDVSTAQVEAARKANTATNVEFKVSQAETLPLEDNTVDLITCSQAVHWFDFKAFCQECKRVLKPNGCLAITNYGNFWCDHKDEDIRNKLAEYFDELYNKELGTFWNEKRRLVEDKLEGIEIPFQDFVRDDSVEIRLQWSVSHLTGYLRSWSAYQKYLEVNPSGQIIEEYQKKVMSAVSSPDASPDDTMVDVVSPLTLLLGRTS